MSRTTVLLVVAALVVAGIPASAAFAQESTGEQPGATFAGVVGVQGAEVEGEVEGRALGQQLAAAETNESKASVIASQADSIRAQLADLREQREDLRERYQSGNMSRGEYRSRLARIVAQTRSLEARLNTTSEAAAGVPEETLRERGVNTTALDELRENAANMTDGEAAEAARQIAGENSGKGLAGEPGPPDDRGPPEDRGAGSEDGDANETETEEDRGNSANAANASESGGNQGNSAGAGDGDRGNAANASDGDGDRGNAANASDGDRGNETNPSDGGDADPSTGADDGDRGTAGSSDDTSDRGNSGDAGSGSDRGDSRYDEGDGESGTETPEPRLDSAADLQR